MSTSIAPGINLQTAAKLDRNQAGGNLKTFAAINVSGNRDGVAIVSASTPSPPMMVIVPGAATSVTTTASDFNPRITVVDEEGVATQPKATRQGLPGASAPTSER